MKLERLELLASYCDNEANNVSDPETAELYIDMLTLVNEKIARIKSGQTRGRNHADECMAVRCPACNGRGLIDGEPCATCTVYRSGEWGGLGDK